MPHRRLKPPVPITDPRFLYVPSAHTNVRETWIRFGWKPPVRKNNGTH